MRSAISIDDAGNSHRLIRANKVAVGDSLNSNVRRQHQTETYRRATLSVGLLTYLIAPPPRAVRHTRQRTIDSIHFYLQPFFLGHVYIFSGCVPLLRWFLLGVFFSVFHVISRPKCTCSGILVGGIPRICPKYINLLLNFLKLIGSVYALCSLRRRLIKPFYVKSLRKYLV